MVEVRYCRNPQCPRPGVPLDPERVRLYNATTCDARCRAAAWKAEHNYGRHDGPEARANGYDGSTCLGCGADVSESGKVHADDCPVFAAQLAQARDLASKPKPRKPSGLQLSWGKALDVVSTYLADEHDLAMDEARERATLLLMPALSPRQRQTLESRQ